MGYLVAGLLACALTAAFPMSGDAAVPATASFTVENAGGGAFAVWYAEGGICNPDPGPHWQMSSDPRHAGVGSVFGRVGRISCSTYFVHHFDVYAERGNHESRACGIVFRGGRLQITWGSPARCVLSRGATFLTLRER